MHQRMLDIEIVRIMENGDYFLGFGRCNTIWSSVLVVHFVVCLVGTLGRGDRDGIEGNG